MSRKARVKDRLLRDGREVEVLRTFQKRLEAGYTRMAAMVRDKSNLQEFEIWYSQLVETHREEYVRNRISSGSPMYGLRVVPPRSDLSIKLALKPDGLVAVLATGQLARIVAEPLAGRAKVEVMTSQGKLIPRPIEGYPIAYQDKTTGILDEIHFIPFAGPGYALLWRGRSQDSPSGLEEQKPLKVALVEAFLRANPSYACPKEWLEVIDDPRLKQKPV